MKTLERLPVLSLSELRQLEANARGLLDTSRFSEAQQVLSGIAEERSRRISSDRLTGTIISEQIRLRMNGRAMQERIVAAFREHPPVQWERDMLKVLANNSGVTTEELSKLLGYSGTYMNWFGIVCHDREPWLGRASDAGKGKQKTYHSDLLVDFGARHDGRNKVNTTWTL